MAVLTGGDPEGVELVVDGVVFVAAVNLQSQVDFIGAALDDFDDVGVGVVPALRLQLRLVYFATH